MPRANIHLLCTDILKTSTLLKKKGWTRTCPVPVASERPLPPKALKGEAQRVKNEITLAMYNFQRHKLNPHSQSSSKRCHVFFPPLSFNIGVSVMFQDGTALSVSLANIRDSCEHPLTGLAPNTAETSCCNSSQKEFLLVQILFPLLHLNKIHHVIKIMSYNGITVTRKK